MLRKPSEFVSLNQANSALKANISVEMQELRLKQQIINETNREARARETAARAAERQAEQSRQAAQQLTAGVAIASGLAARELGQLTAGFVQAAANMETFRASLNSVTGDAEETDRILQRLLAVTVELVGIDTGDLISFAARLMATGLTAEQSITAITGVTQRVAEQGKSAEVTTRVLEQFTQAINSNTITAQDFRPIARELPTLYRDAGNALGVTITSLDDFRDAAEAVGGPTEAIILLLEEMTRASQGADLNTLNAQLDILQDQSRIAAAQLGEHLIPAVVSIVMTLNEWIQAFNELDDETQKAIAYGVALATGLTALTAVVSGAVVAVGALSASLAAITGTAGLGGVATLAGQAAGSLGRVVSILGRLGAAGNLAATAGITLAQAWNQIYNDFQRTAPFEDAQESITDFNVAASETARSLGLTAESLSGLSQEARTEIELLTERADQLRTSIRNAINREDTEGARAFREEYRQVNAQLTELTANLPQVATETEAVTESLAEQFVRSADQVIRLRDAFRTVSEGDDIQAIEAAASNLTSALERELALQLMDAELTAADRLDLELSTARAIEGVNRDAQQRISQISQDRSDEEVAAAERQRDARIAAAERARAAEVAANEAAAASGAAYALQLAEIGNVAQRRAFVAIVERLQDQGLSLDEARERAAQFIPVLATVADGVNTADHAFGNFSSTLVRDADLSADAVANLTRNVIALGTAISGNLQTDQTFIGFGRDITGRATGTTIESDQAAAGQQGRAFVNRLRERQAREASQRLQRGLSEIQNYAVAVSDVLGSIDNDYADLTSRMAENTASFVRLASGDFTALADVALNVIDFIQDREAHLHEVRMRQAAERLAFETEAAERIRSANTIADALGVDPNQFLTPGQARFSPGQRGGELEELGLTAPLTTLPTFDLQAIVDSAPDISTGLTGALEQQLTSAIAVAFANGEPVIEAFQPFFAHLETAMDRAGAAFDTALQGAADPSEIQYRFETLVSETTEFYDLQIRAVQAAATQSGNTARQATFELIQERDNIINEATNALRNASSGTGRFAAFQRAQNYQQRIATNRTPADIDAEYLATFTPGDPIADLPIRGGIETSEASSQQLADLVDPAIAALADFDAGAAFQESIDTFRRSIGAAGATVETINEAFSNFETNVLRPRFEFLRSQILDDDGVIDAAEELALREAGVFTFSDFATPFREIADAAVMGVEASESALANFTADSAFQGNVTAFRESINAAGTTIEDVNTAWSNFVENTLRPEYERLRGLILDDDGVVSAAEELALREAGVFTFEDFTGRFVGIKDSAIMGIQTATTALASYIAESGFEGNVNTFRDSINEAGTTIEDVNTAWAGFVENTLRPEFNRIRGLILNDDGVIDASEELALRRAGVFTFEDFTGQFIGIKDAAIMGIETAGTALADYVDASGFEENVGAFRMSITTAGLTIEDINTQWSGFVENTLRPEFNRIRGLILDDDGIIDATEELALRRAGVFTFEDFTGRFVDIKDAAIMSIETAESVLKNYVAESDFEKNVGAFKGSISAAGLTIEDVNSQWAMFLENVLRPEFNRIRDLILNDDGIIDATEELALRRAGVFTFEDFSGQFIGLKDAAVMGIQTSETALVNYVEASGFEKNVGAFRETLNATGLTIADVNTAWSMFIENVLRPEFNRLRGLILDDNGIIDATEELALRQAGLFTFEDFTGRFIGIKDAAVMGIQTAGTALASYIAESGFEGNVGVFRNSINAAGLTIEDVNTAWDTFVEDVLRPEFNRIRGLILDEDGIIDATEELQLRQAGVFTFEDFTSGFIGIKDAAVMSINTAGDALTNYVDASGFEENVGVFKSSLTAAGLTVEDVNIAWSGFVENTLRPEFNRIRGLILNDDGIIDATEELALRRAGVFTFEDFTSGFIGIKDSAVMGIQSTDAALANYVADSNFGENVEAFKKQYQRHRHDNGRCEHGLEQLY